MGLRDGLAVEDLVFVLMDASILVEGALPQLEVEFGTTTGSETVTTGLICMVVSNGEKVMACSCWLCIGFGEGINVCGGESNIGSAGGVC